MIEIRFKMAFLLIREFVAMIPFSLVDNSKHTWNFTINAILEGNTPQKYDLLPNYPNPFNSTTKLKYLLKNKHKTQLIIFNYLGQQVRTLVNEEQSAGVYTIKWDGKDDAGIQAPSGLYIYKLISGSYINSRKMLLLK